MQNHTAWSILDKPPIMNNAMLRTSTRYKLNILTLDVKLKLGAETHILSLLIWDFISHTPFTLPHKIHVDSDIESLEPTEIVASVEYKSVTCQLLWHNY